MRKKIVALLAAGFMGLQVPAIADDVVWQLRLQNGHPVDCWLEGWTHVIQGAGTRLFLEADTRNVKSGWNACIMLPKRLLKMNED
jgi:hypothetical protein